MIIEDQFYIIAFGIIVGLVLLVVGPKGQPHAPNKKVDSEENNTKNKEINDDNGEGVRNRFQDTNQVKEIQTLSNEQSEEAAALEKEQQQQIQQRQEEEQEERRKQAKIRKDKLLKSLNPKEREEIDKYFKSKAEELFHGKQPSKEERRMKTLMSLLNCGIYMVIIITFLVLVILAFDTADPFEISRKMEIIAISLMRQLQGQPNF